MVFKECSSLFSSQEEKISCHAEGGVAQEDSVDLCFREVPQEFELGGEEGASVSGSFCLPHISGK